MKKKVINWKRNNILLLIIILSVFILTLPFILFGFSNKSNDINGDDAFRKYISNPIPSGVTNIDADITEYQGSNIYIIFTVSDTGTFQNILNSSSTFNKFSCTESDFSDTYIKNKLNVSATNMGSYECYEGGSKNFINKKLLFNRNTKIVIYNEIRL